jgi:hypothetical protein
MQIKNAYAGSQSEVQSARRSEQNNMHKKPPNPTQHPSSQLALFAQANSTQKTSIVKTLTSQCG